MNSYRNFRTELSDYVAGYKRENIAESLKVRVVESSVGKQGDNSKVKVDFPTQLVNYQRNLEKKLQKRELSEEDLIALGEDLARLLMPPGVRDYYYRSRAKLKKGEGLRIQIYTDESALGALPWEYIYIWAPVGESTAKKDTGFLALDREISIVRYLSSEVVEPSLGSEQVKILALLSDGTESGHQQLDMAREEDNLRQALVGVGGHQLEVFNKGKLEGLLDSLTENKAQVFHFAGHGTIEKEPLAKAFTFREDKKLVLVDKEGGEQLWDDEKVAMELGRRGILLVVLSACDSGGVDPGSQFSGGIPTLVQQGIPAVVGMQFTVRDANAIAFSHRFYLALASGKSIDTAVSEGRHGIYQRPTESGRDWGVPVLYLQTDKAVLFPKPVKPLLKNLILLVGTLVVLGLWFILHILPFWAQATEQWSRYFGVFLGATPAVLALYSFGKLVTEKAFHTITSREQDTWIERRLRYPYAGRFLMTAFVIVLALALTTNSIYLTHPVDSDPAEIVVSVANGNEKEELKALQKLVNEKEESKALQKLVNEKEESKALQKLVNEKEKPKVLKKLVTNKSQNIFGGPIFFQLVPRELKLELTIPGWQIKKQDDNVEVVTEKVSFVKAGFWKSIHIELKDESIKRVRLAPKSDLLGFIPDKFRIKPRKIVDVTVTVGHQKKEIKDYKKGVIWLGAPLVRLKRLVADASQTDLFTSLEKCLRKKATDIEKRKMMAEWNSGNYFLEIELNETDTIQVEANSRIRGTPKDSESTKIIVSDGIPPAKKLYGGPYPTYCLEKTKKNSVN